MLDIVGMLQNGPRAKGTFLSRVFGIFSEEIVRIWARDERSSYSLADRRPVLYENEKPYVLDFLFHREDESYVSEMKCEIQYQNYKYWRLTDAGQLTHHTTKKGFQLFLKLAREVNSVPVKAGRRIEPTGTVLVWGGTRDQGISSVKETYGISDVLSVENCIDDLIAWDIHNYQTLLADRKRWVDDLFSSLLGIGTHADAQQGAAPDTWRR